MNDTRLRLVLGTLCLTLFSASGVSAQVFGTFPWQMQPYCNVVTLTLTSTPAGFTLDGTDDQCGAPDKASAVGVATFNAGGLVNVNFTIVAAPSGKSVHVAAVVNPANGNGTWTDSIGNSGTFAIAGATPGLPARPAASSPATAAGKLSYAWVCNAAATSTIGSVTDLSTTCSNYTYNRGGAPTSNHVGTGTYTVSFPGLAMSRGHVQVTSYGTTSDMCKVEGWGASNISVKCYNAAGAATDGRFTVLVIE